MNRRWTTFLNDLLESMKKDKEEVTLRALGTAVNSLFTIANVFEREHLGSIDNITTFDLKDEENGNNSKLGCEIRLKKGPNFDTEHERYQKQVEEGREKRKEVRDKRREEDKEKREQNKKEREERKKEKLAKKEGESTEKKE
eukprot:CAMPEP_0116893276 /NCGR_PEP_ID=MMETSP0467-20121206/3307_1 /TAXON_ID=283647 /ORGANISM="Mesodinium pulex, Strain SPMC105" /LENGTH=141 /DNA_ID=CAMNT_0004562859 /DNA_START=1029 /DNA_END=1454 /DNA_ORIENTATION=-